MVEEALSFAILLGCLHRGIAQMSDPRKSSNATKYTVKDAVLGAFSVFFMQCESFLEHQRLLHTRKGRDNAQTLFGLKRIPTDIQLRNILDGLKASLLFPVFRWVYAALKSRGVMSAYQVLSDQLLIALDGTEYFSSGKISCPCCSHRRHKNGTVTYFHSAILPVIVAPAQAMVISLAPEFITPQDGAQKQDCEQVAAKRWIATHAHEFEGDNITLLGDDLYSRQPLCQLCLEKQWNFIFVCLPESHPALYEWLEYLQANGEVQTFQSSHWNGRYQENHRYRYVNQIPLRETQPALMVNWCELTITKKSDGTILYQNAWITRHFIQADNVLEVVAAARARWKTENENHNVLKTKGYHLEHNFGHGQQHLSTFLLTLNLLAFLFHTVLHLVDESYQQVRSARGTRKGFFRDIETLTKYFLFESWQHLLSFMLAELSPEAAVNTS